MTCLTTSQFVTAPKLETYEVVRAARLTTSQFVTAPKQRIAEFRILLGLTTSQFVTAPKHLGAYPDRRCV